MMSLRDRVRWWLLLFEVWKFQRRIKRGVNIMEAILGVVRAILAAVGGYFVSKGLIDEGVLNSVIGALMVIITGIWSVISKRKAVRQNVTTS
jgi:hypothetical protein